LKFVASFSLLQWFCPFADFISCYQLTFKISQLEKILSSHLKPPFEDLYPSLPTEVAKQKVHFAQAFFQGILQSDVGKPLIFSPSRFRFSLICSVPSINENIEFKPIFYSSFEPEDLLSSNPRKEISVGNSALSFAAYLLLTVKHLPLDNCALKAQIWNLQACNQKKHEKFRVKLIAEQRSNGFDVILGDCFDSKRAIQSLKADIHLFNAAESVMFENPAHGSSIKIRPNQITLRAGAWRTSLEGV
jgi:hypothetical protein